MQKPRILVVDDELFFLRLYAELLEEGDYTVETVQSGEEAVNRIRQGDIDVVLSDMVMPEVDGLEVLRVARSVDNPPDVILVTGHATTESAIQALKSGARDYITKPFNPDELRHLVRTCIEQRRLLDENSNLKTQIQLFQRGQALASMIDIERLLPQALTTLLQETGGRGLAFMINKRGGVDIKGVHGFEEEQASVMAGTLQEQLDSPISVRFLNSDEFTPEPGWPGAVEKIALLALSSQGNSRGGIIIAPPADSLPQQYIHENLLFLAEQINLGFENSYRFLGARELMYTDDLTGLFNHRYLHMAIEKEISRSQRYGLKFSLIFIDLDHFKNVNDSHGHLFGSKTLHEVADLLRASVREVDTLFRYGGDEFTALLVETDLDGARTVAERMRTAIEGHAFLNEEGISAQLTATFGFATFPDHADNKFDLIDMADKAMYNGKKTRNVARAAGDNDN